MKRKRLIIILSILAVILAGVSIVTAICGSKGGVKHDFKLADNTRDGAILQVFCWDFNTIEESMADIANAGYTAIQTSPINECYIGEDGGMQLYGDGKWYYHYQPTDYTIGNYQLGDREQFISMCKTAHEYGIKVIVDVAANHTTPNTDEVSKKLIDAVGGFDKLYHEKGFQDIRSYPDRLDSTAHAMGGLPDIDTENPLYQEYITNYLNDCIACGADGFRFDAARHIALPDDPGENDKETNFWPNVLGGLISDRPLFIYGEVLQGTNERIADYITTIGGATASNYGIVLRNSFKTRIMRAPKLSDYYVGGHDSHAVVWVESHDNYINDKSFNVLDNEDVKLGWAIVASRGVGTPLFFDRPYGSTSENEWGYVNEIGPAGDPIYKSKEVAAVNHFRNAMVGEGNKIKNADNDLNVICVERGEKGIVVVNVADKSHFTVDCSLPDGTYKDKIDKETEFKVSNGKLEGDIGERKVVILSTEDYYEGIEMPSVSADSEEFYNMKSDETSVTLHVEGAQKGYYILGDGKKTDFKDGDKISVGSELGEGDKITLKLYAEGEKGYVTTQSYIFSKKPHVEEVVIENGITVYFNKPDNWNSELSAYVYDDANGGLEMIKDWPGTPMKLEDDGRYSFTMEAKWNGGKIIFNDGSNQYPAQNEAGIIIEADKEYSVE